MKELTSEEIEQLALQSAANMGAAEKMIFEDPKTGELVSIDLSKLTKNQVELLYKVLSQ